MKVSTATQDITRSTDFVEKQMGINADEVFWEALSSTIYSTKRWLTEYAQNASDADPNWTLQLPTIINPYCLFIDNGKSMSKEFMLDQGEYEGCGFCTAFSSTKRDSNDSSGGFGIGRLTGPQGTMFECRNQDGFTRTYALLKNEKGIPSIMMTSEEKSSPDTLTGVTVKVPVSTRECSEIAQSAHKLLRFFVPTPKGVIAPSIVKDYEDVFFLGSDDHNFYSRKGPSLIVGGYEFSIDFSEISNYIDAQQNKICTNSRELVEGSEKYKEYMNLEHIRKFLRLNALVLRLPIGSVDVALNRENLRYTDKTKATILAAFNKTLVIIHDNLSKEIEDSKTLWEARCRYYDIFKNFDSIKIILNPSNIKFKGVPLTTEKYNFNYAGMSLPFVTKYFKLKYGKTKKSKFSGMDMHPIEYNEYVIPTKDTIIIADDNASLINERVEKYLLDNNITKQHISILFEKEDPTDNTAGHIVGKTIAEQIEYLGNPEYILASTLPIPEKLKSKKSVSTRTNSIFSVTTDGCYGSDTRNTYYNNLDVSTLPADTVWVPANNKQVEYSNIAQLMKSSLLENVKVYAVPKCDRGIIPNTWIDFYDYAKSLVGNIEEIQKYRFAIKLLKNTDEYEVNYHNFICRIADFVDISDIIKYNDIVMWLTSLSTRECGRRSELATLLDIEIPEWKPTKPIELKKSIEAIVEKYPMMTILHSLGSRYFKEDSYKLIEKSLKVVRA